MRKKADYSRRVVENDISESVNGLSLRSESPTGENKPEVIPRGQVYGATSTSRARLALDSRITYYFHTEDESFGASTVFCDQCSTVKEFFDHGIQGLQELRPSLREAQIRRVKVTIPGTPFPLGFPWRSAKDFDHMYDALEKQARQDLNKIFDIPVLCVTGENADGQEG